MVKGYLAAKVIGLVVLLSVYAQGASYGGGSGTAGDPYQIWTPQQMNTIGANPGDWGKHFKLMADINMSIYTGTQYKIIGNPAIGIFTGSFDGNNHTISNLTSTTKFVEYVGLFGRTIEATIKNLVVQNVNITGIESIAGGLVGFLNSGTISNCSISGSVTADSAGGLVGNMGHDSTVTNCSSTASVIASSRGGARAGGLVAGSDYCMISNCISTGSIIAYSENDCADAGGLVGTCNESTITNCSSSGSVSTSATNAPPFNNSVGSSGGLVGSSSGGTITNCSSFSSVTASSDFWAIAGGLVGRPYYTSTITSCYCTGSVAATGGTVFKGGLLGSTSPTTPVTGCFWDMDTSGISDGVGNLDPDPSGVVGKTTAEMKTLATFTASPAFWDFLGESVNGTNDYWRMCENWIDYPRLNWQYIEKGDFACPDGVALEDTCRLAEDWLVTYTNPTYLPHGADANGDRFVDLSDFAILAEHWLEGT